VASAVDLFSQGATRPSLFRTRSRRRRDASYRIAFPQALGFAESTPTAPAQRSPFEAGRTLFATESHHRSRQRSVGSLRRYNSARSGLTASAAGLRGTLRPTICNPHSVFKDEHPCLVRLPAHGHPLTGESSRHGDNPLRRIASSRGSVFFSPTTQRLGLWHPVTAQLFEARAPNHRRSSPHPRPSCVNSKDISSSEDAFHWQVSRGTSRGWQLRHCLACTRHPSRQSSPTLGL
jgi:hypothetical protein